MIRLETKKLSSQLLDGLNARASCTKYDDWPPYQVALAEQVGRIILRLSRLEYAPIDRRHWSSQTISSATTAPKVTNTKGSLAKNKEQEK
jgi:hypothetical protein